MYIRSTGNVSPQGSFDQLLHAPASYSGDKLSCMEPDYSSFIDPKQIRRMSRIIKMGVAAAFDCLKDTGVSVPDAIITGTAYGCLADTDIFLTRLIENNEELLSPTAFIQSTHNTVAAQIALLLKCHNYNNTFVHRGFSFESALLDGMTMINEGSVANALVGGVDEIIEASHAILSRFGLYKTNNQNSFELLQTNSKGTLNGEGAAFFLLQKEKSNNDHAKLDGLSVFYKPSGINEIEKKIISFLDDHNVPMKDIGLVITGNNGDAKNDTVYKTLAKGVFANKATAGYKHLCGEYPTSSAFALWLAVNILKTGKVPEICNAVISQNPGKILIYNHYQHIHHSLYLLSAC
jgi:3-oxoacyl-[acyl-carrier-protein] synthase II